MTPTRLRGWVRNGGIVGLLAAGVVVGMRHLWLRKRWTVVIAVLGVVAVAYGLVTPCECRLRVLRQRQLIAEAYAEAERRSPHVVGEPLWSPDYLRYIDQIGERLWSPDHQRFVEIPLTHGEVISMTERYYVVLGDPTPHLWGRDHGLCRGLYYGPGRQEEAHDQKIAAHVRRAEWIDNTHVRYWLVDPKAPGTRDQFGNLLPGMEKTPRVWTCTQP